MPSQKLTELETLTNPSGEDLLYTVDDPNGSPVSKQIPYDIFFANIPSNTSISGTLNVSGNTSISGNLTLNGEMFANTMILNGLHVSTRGLVIEDTFTPANNSVASVEVGNVFYDENYLYIKVSNNTIKRVALSDF